MLYHPSVVVLWVNHYDGIKPSLPDTHSAH